MKMRKSIFLIVAIFLSTVFGYSQNSGNESSKDDLKALNQKIVSLYNQQKYDEALPLASKSVSLSQKFFGANDIETANAMRTLGYINFVKGDKKKAKSILENAFKIYKVHSDLSAEIGAGVAKMLEAIALIKYEESMKSAEKDFETALEWREKYIGVDSVESLTVLAGLANIKYWDRNYKEAAELFRRVVEIGMKDVTLKKADTDLAFYRSECSYRKIDKLENFDDLKRKYKPGLIFGSKVPNGQLPVKRNDLDLGGSAPTKIIESGVVNGKAISLPAPRYPVEARARGAQGTASVQVLINETGDVISACTTSKIDSLLAESAEAAAYSAKFRPTSLDGIIVRVTGTITYVFKY
jgi:TonB family protein